MTWHTFTILIMAPFRALCLRFAAALWPERHKSYTAVIGARYEKTIGTRNLILNEDSKRFLKIKSSLLP